MRQWSWIRLCTVTSLFCSMWRLACRFLLRKMIKHTSLFYLLIVKKVFGKARKGGALFCESFGMTDHSLLKVKSNKDALVEIWKGCLFAALKDKKAITTISRKICVSNNRDWIISLLMHNVPKWSDTL